MYIYIYRVNPSVTIGLTLNPKPIVALLPIDDFLGDEIMTEILEKGSADPNPNPHMETKPANPHTQTRVNQGLIPNCRVNPGSRSTRTAGLTRG